MTEERLHFQAEVGRLLDIVAHSLYSQKEVFLRELVANAADACDRLRYEALTQPELLGTTPDLAIRLFANTEARTLTITDNGIGMSHDELVSNLGTIAKSGTAAFVKNLTGDARKDTSLIGQFGVGFYAAFMVAERVEVISHRAGEAESWHWESDGKGEFTVAPAAEPIARGTSVVLHLREDADEYLQEHRLKRVIQTYSDHIAVPILWGETDASTPMNHASALWTRPKASIEAQQYVEFYRDIGHCYDEPWLTLHWRAEGVIEYTGLLFVPTNKPFDLAQPDRKPHVRLYVKRVFITDEVENLIPPYLRFLRGIVDSEDLPLNLSREMLQTSPMLAKIRSGVVKRVLSDLTKKSESGNADDQKSYAHFWEQFGDIFKEGLYEDFDNRETLLKLARFRSTGSPTLVSLDDYLKRMPEGQSSIFYMSGDSIETLARSPQIEGFKAKGIEVLLLADPVDEFWVPHVGKFQETPFKSVTRGDADLGSIKAKDESTLPKERAPENEMAALIALFKTTLGESVKDVRASERLTDSPVCLVSDENDVDMHLERLMKQYRQLNSSALRILEINPSHPLIRALAAAAGKDGAASALSDFALMLLDQARIVEGDPVADPAAFAARMSTLLQRGLPG